MNTPINFIARNTIPTENTTKGTIDAIKVIEYYLSLHPSNRVKPNSLLYDLAVKQYNENIRNTLIRPPVPSWFCGKINPETDELILELSDEELRASAGVVSDVLTPNLSSEISTPSGYLADNCLYLGTPGSYDYSICEEGLDIDSAENIVSDWLDGMESIGGLGVPAYSGLINGAGSGEGGSGGGGVAGGMSAPPESLPVSMSLTASVRGHSASFGYSSYNWPVKVVKVPVDAVVAMYRKVNGNWNGGKFDWIRQGGQSSKTLENIFNGYGGHTVPANGEQVAFMWISVDGKQRSNLATTTWNS